MGQLVDQTGADFIILRHPMAGAARLLAKRLNLLQSPHEAP